MSDPTAVTTPVAFTAAAKRKHGFVHVLLITTGSVAAVKAPLIVKQLLEVRLHSYLAPFSIHVISMTK